MEKFKPVQNFQIKTERKISELLEEMSSTGFQGRKLGEAFKTLVEMINDVDVTIFLGLAGAMAVSGQSKIISWLIEKNFVDVLVPTGANITEDIVMAMGHNYYLGNHVADDEKLFELGYNRYYDVYGKESDYIKMTELLSDIINNINSNKICSARSLLNSIGNNLYEKNYESLLGLAAKKEIPVFCPAFIDSPIGDALLLSKSKGYNVIVDAVQDYSEFMGMNTSVKESGIILIGGGVPKDFIQLFSVTGSLLYSDRKVPNRKQKTKRKNINEGYYPHKYAVQITTDSPQWGGLSGCTFEEAISWGKETKQNKNVQCFCDATIALPILVQALSEKKLRRKGKKLNNLFEN